MPRVEVIKEVESTPPEGQDAFLLVDGVDKDLIGLAVLIGEIGHAEALGIGTVGADGGDRSAGLAVLLHGLGQVDVGAHVAQHQHKVLGVDVLDVGADRDQSFHGAGVVAAVVLGQTEGGQHSQTAGTARHIPGFAAAQVVEQGLVVALHNDAHIDDAGVAHGGEGEVDDSVSAAEGQGRGGAHADELTQSRVSVVSENKTVEILHGLNLLNAGPRGSQDRGQWW